MHDDSPDHMTAHWQSEDGLSLFYRDFGGPEAAGLPVLCLPGLTRNSRDFIPLAQRLAPRHRVLCPDLRGRGYSAPDPDWRNYQPPTYVADTWRLLDTLGLERVIVVGTSLGGLMAMIMAAQQPNRLAGVVLNDIGPEIAPEGLARIRGYAGLLPPVSDWAAASAQIREVYEIALPDLDDAAWLEYARRSYREDAQGRPRLDYDPAIGRAVQEVSGEAPDPWPLFRALSMPTLALRGALSDILSAATLARMQAEKPDLRVAVIPGRGHVPLLDEPASVAAIDDFLASLAHGGGA
ncbi:MAG: alpha/beta hydrolase [Gammaproteobacteria bacterium]|nr:alpha/beta hydrolase [Gammaproteobacteria bacterium]